MGEGMPDPEPLPETQEPIIYGFEKPSEDGWVSTSSAATGSTIGVIGKNFGTNINEISVSYNGVPALVLRIEPCTEEEELQRIETIVPERAVTGPVVVDHNDRKSNPLIIYIVQVINPSAVNKIQVNKKEGSCYSLWLGTVGGGLISFDGDINNPKDENFSLYSTANGVLLSNTITALFQDHSGRLLAGTKRGGLSIQKEKTITILFFSLQFRAFPPIIFYPSTSPGPETS